MGSATAATPLRAPGEGADPLGARRAEFIGGLDGFLFASVERPAGRTSSSGAARPGSARAGRGAPSAICPCGATGRTSPPATCARRPGRPFFIDHARQTRLKVFGHATAVLAGDAPELAER